MTDTRQQGATTFSPAPAYALPTVPTQARGTPTFQPAPTFASVQRTCNTMAGVVATSLDPSVPRFSVIFILLEDRANTTPQSRLERLATLPLGERLPLVLCLEDPEPHIRVLWGAQSLTPSSAQPSPEDGKFLTFTRDIRLGLLPATVLVQL